MKKSFLLAFSVAALAMTASTSALSAEIAPAYAKVTYHTVKVEGLDIFYREAGNPKNPTVLLLHGFPTSSHMFRELIPALADKYHVIAPDYPGYGHSSAPDAAEFRYTFDHLAGVVESALLQIGCTNFTVYIQDYGAPVGFRIAAKHPDWVRGLIVQNGNAYDEGFGPGFDALKALWKNRSEETEKPIRGVLTLEGTKFQYLHGTRAPEATSPDDWTLAQQLLDRPGNQRIQLELFYDYRNNPPRYADWQAYFRKHQPPTLIVWGKNDPFFPEPGARAYLRDLPQAELHLFDTGHFALEEDSPQITTLIQRFLKKHH